MKRLLSVLLVAGAAFVDLTVEARDADALRARLERINARMGLPTEVQADPEAVYAALLHAASLLIRKAARLAYDGVKALKEHAAPRV